MGKAFAFARHGFMNIHRSIVCFSMGSLLAGAVACTDSPSAPSLSPNGGTATSPITPSSSSATVTTTRFGKRTPGVVFVTTQGLYYDTFVVTDPLPQHGRFQLIANGETEFGPGDVGYLGGRWWEDLNGNGMQDSDDHYFHCPLLPPGRPTP